MREKECLICKKVIQNAPHNTKYCRECNKSIIKPAGMRKFNKRRKEKQVEEIDELFKCIIESKEFKITDLTTRGFKEITGRSAISASRILECDWPKVLGRYGKRLELISYVVKEYRSFYLHDYNCNMKDFCSNHKYITQHLVYLIGAEKIKKLCGFKSWKHEHSEEGLLKNFEEIKNKYGRIPLCREFQEDSKINIHTYLKYFQTSSYDVVLEHMKVSRDELLEYEKDKKRECVRISKIGASTHFFSIEEKEEEFKKVFDEFYNKYGKHPTRRQFDRLSKFSEKAYTKTFKKSWNEVRIMYGYEPTYNKNISEKECLELVSEVLETTYIPQKTWNWLLSDKNSNLYIDGYYPEYNLCVEFDGVFHRVSIDHYGGEEKLKRHIVNDKRKDELVSLHGLKMLRIDSRHDWHNPNYIAKRLKEVGIDVCLPKEKQEFVCNVRAYNERYNII